jgi:hypothetical protein
MIPNFYIHKTWRMRMIKLSDLLKGSLKLSGLVLLVLVVVALSACGMGAANQPTPTQPLPTAVGGGAVAVLPTPLPGENVGTGASSGALDTAEGTWGNYLRDMIAEQNQSLASKINLLERYANPELTQKNLAGTVKSLELVADRTKIDLNASSTVASVKAEFDVRLTFANGDSDTRTCKMGVEIDLKDATWYVLNPAPLAVFSVCPK